MEIRVILLDIEGTTTSVKFVYEALFPYARTHLQEFLQASRGQPKLAAELEHLREEYAADADRLGCPPWPAPSEADSALGYLNWLMDQDRKSPALKAIQGRIWEAGYRRGELRGHVYEDVPPALRRWRERGKEIYIFSSGSVLAQQLLFAHTREGDLRPLIQGYFDTTAGPKTDAASYRNIAQALDRLPAEMLFISDSVPELDAARQAGMATLLCLREDKQQNAAHEHTIIGNFAALNGDAVKAAGEWPSGWRLALFILLMIAPIPMHPWRVGVVSLTACTLLVLLLLRSVQKSK